ncbi:MAG: aldehyde dehydrogenase family protein, partial [Pseudomonadota bacterium]
YVGEVVEATPEICAQTLHVAVENFSTWQNISIKKRCEYLLLIAQDLVKKESEWIHLIIREVGKTWQDARTELREAIDFCRFYAEQARNNWGKEIITRGTSGESRYLIREPLGIVCCISPWNFPLAIFVGQIAAALVTGNTVIAKPSSQASLIAQRAVDTFHRAGVPKTALLYLPCSSYVFEHHILTSSHIQGIGFTGSKKTADKISTALNRRINTPFPRFIAETGGINSIVVDSSALIEQAVEGIIESAFNNAGQRCSSARIVFLQQEIAETAIQLIKGRMDTLKIGDPINVETDIGPVIHAKSLHDIQTHIEQHRQKNDVVYQPSFAAIPLHGNFIAPTLIQINDWQSFNHREIFGPVLHCLLFKESELNKVVDYINQLGHGLTFGFYSRIQTRIHFMSRTIRVGNIFINRNIINATVEAHPFGGIGLSGNGHKSGGLETLNAFSNQKTIVENTSALGINPDLVS